MSVIESKTLTDFSTKTPGDGTSATNREACAWGATLLLVACVATWLTFSSLHNFQNADSVLPVLISLQRWTPFFWEQDRFGMLVPLLARPVSHPLANLLLQAWLTTAAGLLTPFLVARYLTRGSSWFASGSLADMLLLTTVTPMTQFDWLVTQPYALSSTLGVASLLVLEQPGAVPMFGGALLMALALWVNVGVGIVLLPLILFRARTRVPTLALTIIGMATISVVSHALRLPRTTMAIAGPSEWPHAWMQLMRMSSSAVVAARIGAIAVVVAIIVASAFASGSWRRIREPSRAAAIAMLTAVTYWLVTGTFE